MAGFSLCQFNLTMKNIIVSCLIFLLSFSVMANEKDRSTDTAQDSSTNSVQDSSNNSVQDCVIVLHGLGRTAFSMRKIANTLSDDYQVINDSYPSRKYDIASLAKIAIDPALKSCKSAPRIHFVTHSLGGILVRQYLSQYPIENLGHVVMLGPPNQGSEVVDYFQSYAVPNWFFSKVNGPAGKQLGTKSDSRPIELGAVDFSLGVIAGTVSYNPLFSNTIDDQDDGKVSVSSTKIEGMSDHLILPINHTTMMNDDVAIMQIKHYLQHGAFKRD